MLLSVYRDHNKYPVVQYSGWLLQVAFIDPQRQDLPVSGLLHQKLPPHFPLLIRFQASVSMPRHIIKNSPFRRVFADERPVSEYRSGKYVPAKSDTDVSRDFPEPDA